MDSKLTMHIKSADSTEVEEILNSALSRKQELFPDWDILYIALPKNNPEKRALTLEYIRKWSLGK